MPHVHNPKNHNKINVMNLTFVLLKPKRFFILFYLNVMDQISNFFTMESSHPSLSSFVLPSQVSKEDINYYARSLSLWL